jgi:hypothetical protein
MLETITTIEEEPINFQAHPLIARFNQKVKAYNRVLASQDRDKQATCLSLLREISFIVENEKLWLVSNEQRESSSDRTGTIAEYSGIGRELKDLLQIDTAVLDSHAEAFIKAELTGSKGLPIELERLHQTSVLPFLSGPALSSYTSSILPQIIRLNEFKASLNEGSISRNSPEASSETFEAYYYQLHQLQHKLLSDLAKVIPVGDNNTNRLVRSLIANLDKEMSDIRQKNAYLVMRDENMQSYLQSNLSREFGLLSSEQLRTLATYFKNPNAFNLEPPQENSIKAHINGLIEYDIRADELRAMHEHIKSSDDGITSEKIKELMPSISAYIFNEEELQRFIDCFTKPKAEIHELVPCLQGYSIQKLGGQNNVNWKITSHDQAEEYVIQAHQYSNFNLKLLDELNRTPVAKLIGQVYLPEQAMSKEMSASFSIVDFAYAGDLKSEAEERKSQVQSNSELVLKATTRIKELVLNCQLMLENGVMHPDIKLANFLVDEFGQISIRDTKTLCRVRSDGSILTGDFDTTREFQAPERETSQLISAEKFMSYQLGLAFYQALVLPNSRELVDEKLWQQRLDFTQPIFTDSEEGQRVAEIIQGMTTASPQHRLPLATVIEGLELVEELELNKRAFSDLKSKLQEIKSGVEEEVIEEFRSEIICFESQDALDEYNESLADNEKYQALSPRDKELIEVLISEQQEDLESRQRLGSFK